MVDISMADGALSWLAMVAGRYFCDGEVPRRGEQQLAGGLVCYLPYEAADGWISCGALEPKFWAALCNGRRPARPDREASSRRRAPRPGARSPRSSAHAPATSGSPSTTSTTAASSRSSTSTRRSTPSWSGRARWWSRWSSRVSARCASSASPLKLSRTPADPTRPAPAFGEHTDEVLREAGYSAEEIASMIESGAVAGPSADAAALRSSAHERPATAPSCCGWGSWPRPPASRPRRSSTTCARASCRSRSRRAATWPTTRPSSSTGSG